MSKLTYDVSKKTTTITADDSANQVSAEDINEMNKNFLRAQRQVECFQIINRGNLWYSTLTEEQLSELNVWYQAWLKVTQTLVIPIKPTWL